MLNAELKSGDWIIYLYYFVHTLCPELLDCNPLQCYCVPTDACNICDYQVMGEVKKKTFMKSVLEWAVDGNLWSKNIAIHIQMWRSKQLHVIDYRTWVYLM